MTQLLAAPDVQSLRGKVTTGGNAVVVDSRSRNEAAVLLSDLGALPAGKTYQLWLMGPGTEARSAGLVSGGGIAGPVFSYTLGTATAVGLTIEPAGGTPQPTTNPILVVTMGA
jgi:anti-sigma-K factor RskA